MTTPSSTSWCITTPLGSSTGPSPGEIYELVGFKKKKGSTHDQLCSKLRDIGLTFWNGIAELFGMIGVITPNSDYLQVSRGSTQ
jgi:hypothetical protein